MKNPLSANVHSSKNAVLESNTSDHNRFLVLSSFTNFMIFITLITTAAVTPAAAAAAAAAQHQQQQQHSSSSSSQGARPLNTSNPGSRPRM